MIVLDASVLVNALADDHEDGERARGLLRGATSISAPDLVDVETVAVFRRRWLAGHVSAERFEQAVGDLEDLAIERWPALPLMRRAHELRDNLTPYDATYVALAEVLGCPLVTADRRMAAAPGVACEIVLP